MATAPTAKGEMPVWLRDQEHRSYSLRITKAGLQAIKAEASDAPASNRDPKKSAGTELVVRAARSTVPSKRQNRAPKSGTRKRSSTAKASGKPTTGYGPRQSDGLATAFGSRVSGGHRAHEAETAAHVRKARGRQHVPDYGRRQADPVVLRAMARAHLWFYELSMGKAKSMAEIALRENITDNYVSNLIYLAWLAPLIVDQIFDGDPQATLIGRNAIHTRRRLKPNGGKAPKT